MYAIGRHRQRGTALTELVLCLLPYLIVLLGAIFFWHLMLGKQEVIKYSTSAAMPGEGTISESAFFGKLKGTATRSGVETFSFGNNGADASFNDLAQVTEEDEPVLPYKNNGEDLKRAIELAGISVYYSVEEGGYKLSLGETGNRLKALGFLDVDTKAVYKNTDDIKVNVTQMDMLQEASQALGEWVSYRGAYGNYTYTVPFGKGRLPMEAEAPDQSAGAWRSSGGMKLYKKPPYAFWAIIEDPALRSWSGFSDLTSSLNTVFTTTFGTTLAAPTFSESAGYQLDKSVIPSYSGSE